MAPSGDAMAPSTRRQRTSMGGKMPSSKATEKENATVDLGSNLAANRKKSRSKSMGPGGLDVLKNGNGNRRASLAAPARPPPRSILKPTIAPLAEIPALKKDGPRSKKSRGSSTTDTTDSDASGSKIALRTEEEQQASSKEREEKERREARRKSLANRRVSFAAEATLHTFHEIEFNQDSTTSTDSTRASTLASKRPSSSNDHDNHNDSDQFATPAREENEGETESPTKQRDQPERKRRRSSALPPTPFTSNHHEDNTTASSIYSSDSEPADAVEEIQEEEDGSSSDSDSDADEGTMVTVEDHEVTGTSVMSGMSGRSEPGSNQDDSLEEALRMATQRAGTQRLDDDDSEGEEVIPSFGWIKKNHPPNEAAHDQENQPPPHHGSGNPENDDGTEMEMDITGPLGGIMPAKLDNGEYGDEQEKSMDVTSAFGGILTSMGNSRSYAPPQGDAVEDAQVDETMELTRAIGGIQKPGPILDDHDENEDMSMEFTTAIGGLLPSQSRQSGAVRRRTLISNNGMDDATMDMDMTMGVGKILPAAGEAQEKKADDATMGMDTIGVGRIVPSTAQGDGEGADQTVGMDMDMTTAVGGIINESTTPESRVAARKHMEEEADKPDTPSKILSSPNKSPSKKLASAVKNLSVASSSPNKDPFQGTGLGRSMPRRSSATPESSPFKGTPSPERQAPQTRTRARSPVKAAMVHARDSSPVKASSPVRTPQSQQTKQHGRSRLPDAKPVTPSPAKSTGKASALFDSNPGTGNRTPSVVLTPQTREITSVGANRSGLGSPRVAALFDRRGSIGDTAQNFEPGKSRAVSFVDPRVIEDEIERDRQDEEDRESGRNLLQREVDGPDSSLTLKEMISSMSPKKKPMKGRKSLHVGSAKGLLGKRPSELDEDEEAEEQDGVKRLKGHQGSPVKNVRLQQPPSKAETTGRRLTKTSGLDLGVAGFDRATPSTSSVSPQKDATTPRGEGRFRNVEDDTVTHSVELERLSAKGEAPPQNDGPEERIHLQEFLDMTSIRFMELTTTKRRHTQAPESFKNGIPDGEDEFPLGRCVVAGACTVPMLELYQHSCRELKKYISEGRRIVREIETETFEENPPLFREYMSATPEFKSVLDNQFKNGKTHARLESKAMWYEWRMALQHGLREGLVKTAEGMATDEKLLKQQEKLLSSVVPTISSRFQSLEEEHNNLETYARELEDCDPAELDEVRQKLGVVEGGIEEKTRKIAELRKQLEESEHHVDQLTARKQDCLESIQEAEKIREECRGWSTSEISALQARVDALEKRHGWAITGISDSTVSLTYRRDIELVLDVSSFQRGQRNSQLDLWYIGGNGNVGPQQACPVDKEFFVQCIRDHVRGLPQSRTAISHVLHMVRAAWDSAVSTCNDIRRLGLTFPTIVERTSDSSVAVKASLLIAPAESKVEIILRLHGVSRPDGVEFSIHPEARVVYGEDYNTPKMGTFLSTHLGDKVVPGEQGHASWSDVVVDLYERLLVRGRK